MIEFNNQRDITNKWPAMIVKGDSVTPLQAAEILFKTDSSFPDFTYAGNDRDFRDMLNTLFGIPNRGFMDSYEKLDELFRECGILTGIDYLTTDRIFSCYVGGPHGWCDWDGTIFSNNYNIGKWPNVEDVAHEWDHILDTFPYLNLTCQLFDAETCEENATPVVTFFVGDGVVRVEDADEAIDEIDSDLKLDHLFTPERERGISFHELKKKVMDVYGYIPRVDNIKGSS